MYVTWTSSMEKDASELADSTYRKSELLARATSYVVTRRTQASAVTLVLLTTVWNVVMRARVALQAHAELGRRLARRELRPHATPGSATR